MRKSEARKKPIQGRQTNRLAKRLALKMLVWSFPTQKDVCICPGSFRWLVFNCATVHTAPTLFANERRRFVIPIWAVSA